VTGAPHLRLGRITFHLTVYVPHFKHILCEMNSFVDDYCILRYGAMQCKWFIKKSKYIVFVDDITLIFKNDTNILFVSIHKRLEVNTF
jgi:hypothetical protein